MFHVRSSRLPPRPRGVHRHRFLKPGVVRWHARDVVRQGFHVTNRERFDSHDHLAVGVATLAVLNPLQLTQQVVVMRAINQRIGFARVALSIFAVTVRVMLFVEFFPMLEVGAATLARRRYHLELLDIGGHIGDCLGAADLFRDGIGIHGGVIPVFIPDISQLFDCYGVVLTGDLWIGAVGQAPALWHMADSTAFVEQLSICPFQKVT